MKEFKKKSTENDWDKSLWLCSCICSQQPEAGTGLLIDWRTVLLMFFVSSNQPVPTSILIQTISSCHNLFYFSFGWEMKRIWIWFFPSCISKRSFVSVYNCMLCSSSAATTKITTTVATALISNRTECERLKRKNLLHRICHYVSGRCTIWMRKCLTLPKYFSVVAATTFCCCCSFSFTLPHKAEQLRR